MKKHLRIALMPELLVAKYDYVCNTLAIEFVDLDIEKLIDDYEAITKVIDENRHHLTFDSFMYICDWLFGWYKKNDHYILSNRILNTFRYVLSMAQDRRELIK